VNSNVPTHSALYVATDKNTALQETLGQQLDETGQLTPQEIALTNPQSETIVSVSGYLEKVFDLRSHKSLNALLAIIKKFKFSEALLKRAKALNLEAPRVIQNPKELLPTLLAKNWRIHPENLDIPSNSQVFGHLLFIAGIEGVVYPSKLTGEDCLAIFPHNFDNSSSFIQIDGEVPNSKVPRRIDAKTWPLCDFNFEDFSEPGSIIH
jgi:hypothetical protein